MICNHPSVSLAVGGTRWRASEHIPGLGTSTQAQGDVRRRLQPGGWGQCLHQPDCPHPHPCVHWGGKGGPWARLRSHHPAHRSRGRHEGGRRKTAWAILSSRRLNLHESSSLRDSSEQNEREPTHTPTVGHYTAHRGFTLGYLCCICLSLIITYLCFALIRLCIL